MRKSAPRYPARATPESTTVATPGSDRTETGSRARIVGAAIALGDLATSAAENFRSVLTEHLADSSGEPAGTAEVSRHGGSDIIRAGCVAGVHTLAYVATSVVLTSVAVFRGTPQVPSEPAAQ